LRVSVIMPTYNSEEYLAKSIDSILYQTYKDLELIICDDASTDSTLNIIKKYVIKDSRIKYVQNEQNMGAAYSRNRCIEIANGDFICLQDSDDISVKDRIEKQVEFLEENKEFDFVGSWIQCFDGEKIWRSHELNYSPQKSDFLKGMPFAHASVLFKKEVFKKVKGYRVSKDTLRGEDLDLFMNLYSNNMKGATLQEYLYMYREDKNALKRRTLSTRLSMVKNNIIGFKKLGLMPAGYIYAIKPVITFFIPVTLYKKFTKN